MNKSTGRSIQVGYLDAETNEIIELIHSHPMPADFFQWLSGGTFTFKILQERMNEGKYTRIAQYFIEDVLVFTGRIEYDVTQAPKDMVQFLTKKRSPIDTSMPGFAKFQKEPVSKVSVDLYYTIISTLHSKDEMVGFVWEIFELPAIIKIYSKINDPLRHWRMS